MGELASLLPWDSQFFGGRIGRIWATSLSPATCEQALAWAEREQIDGLYLLADAADQRTVMLAEQAGFRLYDIRVTLERPLGPEVTVPTLPPGATIRAVRTDDASALAALAAASHTDSRFFADPRLAPRAPALYQAWLRNSIADAAAMTLILCWDEQPAGYIACSSSGNSAQISLIAVSEAVRGRGLGLALVGEALVQLAARGAAQVSVVTQGRNVAAQRLYQRVGFRTAQLQLWYHRWFT